MLQSPSYKPLNIGGVGFLSCTMAYTTDPSKRPAVVMAIVNLREQIVLLADLAPRPTIGVRHQPRQLLKQVCLDLALRSSKVRCFVLELDEEFDDDAPIADFVIGAELVQFGPSTCSCATCRAIGGGFGAPTFEPFPVEELMQIIHAVANT